jgi:aminopeptidase N
MGTSQGQHDLQNNSINFFMRKSVLLLILLGVSIGLVFAQQPQHDETWQHVYRAFAGKVNDLVHTKLEARFDYARAQLNGKIWLTLQPHFYPVDSVQLDAKGMDIHKLELTNAGKNMPLSFSYDSLVLKISLGKTFTRDKPYTLYIEYTAKPNEIKAKGSTAINEAKGLYFIDPDGTDPDKPTQIWTQGETESNSVWMPTIDKPNQKSTEEMILTVPAKYVTLSNGKRVSSKPNNDGTRTDTWRMDQPHAPYLFFIGVGEYAVVKDSYNGKEVSYYVEKPYESVARKIFGDTPEMMKFFSKQLGVEYPWAKYSQITGRDYVSGAMENTTATLHGEWAQQNARELEDGNSWETVIAHELFHQWFGDLVTCESWSNLTVNESFADYSEGMWMEHKYGKDAGEAEQFSGMQGYLNSKEDTADALVRHYYADKEDVFDAVTYQKGGAILNMLRNFVGDDAFYKSLNTYLTRNLFGTGNARELQQAFEDVTGKDLNWFFDQWYFSAGHPELDISYGYDEKSKQALVYIKQLQAAPPFQIPLYIDVYVGKNRTRHFEWIRHVSDTFRVDASRKPDLIDVDAEKTLVAGKIDHKTLKEYVFQYEHAGNYVDRWEAIDFAAGHVDEPEAISFLTRTLKDPNFRLRVIALNALRFLDLNDDVLARVVTMAEHDPNKVVSAGALFLLATQKRQKDKELFIRCLKDSSYSVAGAAYSGLIGIDESAALSWLPELKKDAMGTLATSVERAEILTKTDADFDEMYERMANSSLYEQHQSISNFLFYLNRVNDVSHFKKGMDLALDIRDELEPYLPTYKAQMSKKLIEMKEAKKREQAQGNHVSEMQAQIRILEKILEE